jgi:hypothetical protein
MSVKNKVPAPRYDPEMSNLVYEGGRSQKVERVDCPGGAIQCAEANPHYHLRATVVCACGGSTQVQYSRFTTPRGGRRHSTAEGRPTTTVDRDNLNPCADCRRLFERGESG